MGAKLAKVRGGLVIDERYTQPCGLYQHKNIDGRKLRKLILDGKLAPCYPGVEDITGRENERLEECPICFLVRPHATLIDATIFREQRYWYH